MERRYNIANGHIQTKEEYDKLASEVPAGWKLSMPPWEELIILSGDQEEDQRLIERMNYIYADQRYMVAVQQIVDKINSTPGLKDHVTASVKES